MMNRTTIMLPSSLKEMVTRLAKIEGISFGEFIRESLKIKINLTKEAKTKARDPFYAFDKVFEEKTSTDIAKNHDDYLYE